MPLDEATNLVNLLPFHGRRISVSQAAHACVANNTLRLVSRSPGSQHHVFPRLVPAQVQRLPLL